MIGWASFLPKKKVEDALSKMSAKYSTFFLVGLLVGVWRCLDFFLFSPLSYHDSKVSIMDFCSSKYMVSTSN